MKKNVFQIILYFFLAVIILILGYLIGAVVLAIIGVIIVLIALFFLFRYLFGKVFIFFKKDAFFIFENGCLFWCMCWFVITFME